MSEETKMDKLTTEFAEYICNNICVHTFNDELTQEEVENICIDCKIGEFVCDVSNEYNRIFEFDKSQSAKLMQKYSEIVMCNDCDYCVTVKETGDKWCRLSGGLAKILGDKDGCSAGKESVD